MDNTAKRLPTGAKYGYAVGQIGVSVPYNIVGVYLLFFFTNIAGISPSFAGTIFMIAVLWAAFADPFIGIFSDNLRTKYGRRRPILIAIAVPYAAVTWLLFTNFDFGSDMTKNIYFVVMAILFYTAMTFTEVPFYSLGAEITTDFDDRTRVRVVSSFFVYVAVLIAVNLPNMVTAQVEKAGGTPQQGWSYAALIGGIVAAVALVICWRATRGRELVVGEKTEAEVGAEMTVDKNIFKAFIDELKIKPVKFIVLANLLYLLGFSIFSGVTVYVLLYLAGADPVTLSIVMSVLPIATILWLPLINKLSVAWGKKKAYIVLIGVIAIAMLIFFTLGIYTPVSIAIFQAIAALGNGAFWTLCFSMAYDTVEVDEWVNNKRREGILVAYMSFAQKIGTALAMWLSGLLLEYIGYDGTAATQTEGALSGLSALYTWIPAIFIVVSIISVIRYPLTKKKHMAITEALALRKEGKPYDTKEFEDLI